jgi:hypothetical protein
MYVRLKPYKPALGYFVKRHHRKGVLYAVNNETGRPIFYMVNDPVLLEELRNAKQEDNNPRSAELFDVLSKEEYERVTKREDDLRLVELGMASDATVEPIVSKPPIDRTSKGRASAIPAEDIDAPAPLVKEVIPEPVEASTVSEDDQTIAVPKRRGRPPSRLDA